MERKPRGNPEFIVTLSSNQAIRIREIAETRYIPKREVGIEYNPIDQKRDPMDIEILGVGGEFAAAKYLCLSLNDKSLLMGDNGIDLITPEGFTIDVKTGRKRGYDFALKDDNLHSFKADIGILVWGTNDSPLMYWIVGWTTKIHFALNHRIKDYGYGKRLIMKQDDMLDISRLKQAIEGCRL